MRAIEPQVVVMRHDPEQMIRLIAYAARMCYKSEPKGGGLAEDKDLIRRLLSKHPPHLSILDHEKLTVVVTCDRGITHELVRHRIGVGYSQESTRYCVAGDMQLTTKNPHHKLTVAELFKLRDESINGSWKRILIKQMNDSGELVYSKIKDIFYTGIKPTLKIKTRLGYELVVTNDHEIHTEHGYKRARDLSVGDILSVNGTEAIYTNKKWLGNQYNMLNKTAVAIAGEFGLNVSTVKKWIKKHGLPKKPRSYWNKGRIPWNKGLSETADKRVAKQVEALREHHWDLGRVTIPKQERVKKLSKTTYHKSVEDSCSICGDKINLQVHHTDGERENNKSDNLLSVCSSCHLRIHSKNLTVIHSDEIVEIIPNGSVEVFDISMGSLWPNFVANGVVVHNCNYEKEKFGREITVIRPPFWPHHSEQMNRWERSMEEAERSYMQLIDNEAKAQEARSVLPNSLKTEIVVTMTLSAWRHFFKLRASIAAHPSMTQLAVPLLKHFKSTDLEVFFTGIDVIESHYPDADAKIYNESSGRAIK